MENSEKPSVRAHRGAWSPFAAGLSVFVAMEAVKGPDGVWAVTDDAAVRVIILEPEDLWMPTSSSEA